MSTLSNLSAADLEAACRALTKVERTNLGYEVQVPVIYPNGDFATVVVSEQMGGFIVHDAGFAAMTLANHGIVMTTKMRSRIEHLSRHYGCEFSNERMARKADTESLPLVVAVVANASRTIADQILQAHPQPVFSFRQEVIDRVKSVLGDRVRENAQAVGNSGTAYTIGAMVLDTKHTSPVALIEAVKDIDGVNKKFREFYDLARVPYLAEAERITLYDDRAPLRPTDLVILQDVSNVVRFSDVEPRLRDLVKADGDTQTVVVSNE